MKESNIGFKLKALYFIGYTTLACYYPYLTVFFQRKGLRFSEIGVLFALNSLVAVVCQPVWGYITDRYSNKKQIVMITCVASGIAILMLPFVNSFIYVMLGITIFMAFQSPIFSIVDAYCYEIIDKNHSVQYGQVRLMGSLSYAIMALSAGFIIKYSNVNTIFYLYTVLILFSAFILYTIPYKGKSSGSYIKAKDIFKIIKTKGFMIFVVATCFINMALGSNGSYISILIQKTGGDVSQIGILWFVLAMSELPVFYFGNRLLKKYGELRICTISLFLYSIRFFIDSICPTYSMVILTQIMQSITFPLFLMSSLQFVNKILPKELRTTGITLYSAIGAGVGGFIGNMGGGLLLEWVSIFDLFRIMACASIIAMIVVIILKSRYKPFPAQHQ